MRTPRRATQLMTSRVQHHEVSVDKQREAALCILRHERTAICSARTEANASVADEVIKQIDAAIARWQHATQEGQQ